MIIPNESEVGKKSNTIFADAVKKLNIDKYIMNEDIEGNIEYILKRYSQFSSILKVKEQIKIDGLFNFTKMTAEDMKTEINNLKTKKTTAARDIPAISLIGSR